MTRPFLEQYLTTDEVADAFGVSRRSIMSWKADGRIRPVGRAGAGRGVLLWSPDDVARWVAEREAER